ncbi:NAD-dependent epimerase/dehydratase family protein [Brachyspira intermedia]|uniref:NAD-dependent epimerase/dehydratase family protein n=1 Tax=Brachyspira intermedia TaxID=84377 RepID=UPI003005E57C
MKKIIVTGINGLIGQYITEPLKELGFEVYGIGTRDLITDQFNYIKLNINNITQLENTFKEIKPEYLIHLAWDTKQGYLDSDSNFDLLASSVNMLKYFKENGGKRVIYTGTCFEYKFKDSKIKEYDELNPTTIYAKCKNYLREISELYCSKYNIDFCWCRIFYMYGENENENRLFPYIINNLKNDKKVSINHSQLEKDYIYAGDAARILSLIINSDINGIINICSGKGLKLKDLATMIAEKLGKLNLLELKELSTEEPLKIIGNNSRIIDEVKFTNYTDINKVIDKLTI